MSSASALKTGVFKPSPTVAGEIYDIKVVPCGSSLCVLNIRQTEAKVEAILSDFVQLSQHAGQDAAQVCCCLHQKAWITASTGNASRANLQEVVHCISHKTNVIRSDCQPLICSILNL